MNMRKTALLATVTMILLASAVVATVAVSEGASSNDPTTSEVMVYGYVTNLSDQEANTPLEGVQVELYTGPEPTINGALLTSTTDENGRFEFTFQYTQGSAVYLMLTYSGYAVRSLPDLSMEMVGDGYIRVVLEDDMLDDDGNYALTGSADGYHAIVMAITNGIIYGTVYGVDDNGNRRPLNGAEVILVSENSVNYKVHTDQSGYFYAEVPYGDYTMTVSCQGYTTMDPVTVSTGSDSPIVVEINEVSSAVFLGLDSAHTLMVIGIVLMALILAIVFTIMHWSNRTGTDITIVTEEDDDGDEVNHR